MAELREASVLKKFSLYSGETEEQTPRWELCKSLCGECMGLVGSQALDGGSLEPLESLAAAEAFYQMTLIDETLAPESVSAPELKLEMGQRGEKARKLLEEKRRACRGLVQEKEFYFGSVKA